MPFLDGFLSGVVDQHQRMQDQNREDAQNQQTTERSILSHMMTSDDPEIKAHAVAGMLDSTSPNKKKGGFRGWLGEVQNNPHLDKIRALVAHDQAVGHMVPPEVGHAAGQMTAAGDPAGAVGMATSAAAQSSAPAGTPSGSPETPGVQPTSGPTTGSSVASPTPPGERSAALPAESPTQIGSPPPSPTTGPTAAASTADETLSPGQTATPAAVLGQPAGGAASTAGAPPVSASKGGVAPSAILGQPPVAGVGPLSPRGDVFPSPETQTRRTAIASHQGDVEGVAAGLRAAGFSEDEIKQELKLHYGRGAGSGMAPSSVKGEAPDANGKFSPTYAILNKATRQYEDPNGTPIPGFRPLGGAAQHFGVQIEAVSQRLFGKPFGQLSQEEQTQAQTEVENTVGRTATARGQGTNAAKLDAPIGVTNALKYGVPANTTLRQLQGQIPLSQQDQDKVHSISTLEGTLANVDALLPKVFPEVGPGIMGRIKTGLSLFGQSAGRQEDITKLNAEIASVMPAIVKANGVSQRLNQKELDLAAQQMVNTSAIHGDTLESAQAKMEILHDLVRRVGGSMGPTSLAAPGAPQVGSPPPAPAAAGAAPVKKAAAAGPDTPVAGLQMVGGKLTGTYKGHVYK